MIDPPNLSGNYADDFPRLKEFFESIFTGINLDNLDAEEITKTTGLTGVPLVVDHNLDRAPTRFIITRQDKAGSVIMTASTVKTITIEGSEDTMEVTFLLQ